MIGLCYLQVVREIDTVRKFNQGFVVEFSVNYVIQFSIFSYVWIPSKAVGAFGYVVIKFSYGLQVQSLVLFS